MIVSVCLFDVKFGQWKKLEFKLQTKICILEKTVFEGDPPSGNNINDMAWSPWVSFLILAFSFGLE